jgi:hypothetical protein
MKELTMSLSFSTNVTAKMSKAAFAVERVGTHAAEEVKLVHDGSSPTGPEAS